MLLFSLRKLKDSAYKKKILNNPTVTTFKVVSSDKLGGSKIAPISGYWPGTGVLDIVFF
jgi:hypothetical protein